MLKGVKGLTKIYPHFFKYFFQLFRIQKHIYFLQYFSQKYYIYIYICLLISTLTTKKCMAEPTLNKAYPAP